MKSELEETAERVAKNMPGILIAIMSARQVMAQAIIENKELSRLQMLELVNFMDKVMTEVTGKEISIILFNDSKTQTNNEQPNSKPLPT